MCVKKITPHRWRKSEQKTSTEKHTHATHQNINDKKVSLFKGIDGASGQVAIVTEKRTDNEPCRLWVAPKRNTIRRDPTVRVTIDSALKT
ncbi:MAG: hypothetical protein KAG53_01735 [Endozoicomonadaceae bacterium]|nr:hypothetical protein [Endozoicomonadaceae bacterium]